MEKMTKWLVVGLILLTIGCSKDDKSSENNSGEELARNLFNVVTQSSLDLDGWNVYGIWEEDRQFVFGGSIERRIKIDNNAVTFATRCRIDGQVIWAGVRVSADIFEDVIHIRESRTNSQSYNNLNCIADIQQGQFSYNLRPTFQRLDMFLGGVTRRYIKIANLNAFVIGKTAPENLNGFVQGDNPLSSGIFEFNKVPGEQVNRSFEGLWVTSDELMSLNSETHQRLFIKGQNITFAKKCLHDESVIFAAVTVKFKSLSNDDGYSKIKLLQSKNDRRFKKVGDQIFRCKVSVKKDQIMMFRKDQTRMRFGFQRDNLVNYEKLINL